MDKDPTPQRGVIEGDLYLNDSCSVSFEVPKYAAFHFNPDKNLRIAQKKRAFSGALRKLATLLKKQRDGSVLKNGKSIDPRLAGVRYVSMTSWIVKKNAAILEREGFSSDFGDDQADAPKLIEAYEKRMRRFDMLVDEGAAMRMTVDDFIQRQLS